MDGFHSEKFLHVVFVIVALGGVFVLPFMQAFAEKTNAGATRFFLNFSKRLQSLVMRPGSVLVLVFGGLTMSNKEFPGHDDLPAWLIISLIWYVIATILVFVFQRRQLQQALEALEGVPDEAPTPEAYKPIGRLLQIGMGLYGVSIIVITLLMVWQPGS